MKIDLKDLSLKEQKIKLNSYSSIEFTEDFSEDTFFLFEAVSKEQKEKGQREMWKQSHHVINQLEDYFHEKWSNPKNLKNKKRRKKEIKRVERIF